MLGFFGGSPVGRKHLYFHFNALFENKNFVAFILNTQLKITQTISGLLVD